MQVIKEKWNYSTIEHLWKHLLIYLREEQYPFINDIGWLKIKSERWFQEKE